MNAPAHGLGAFRGGSDGKRGGTRRRFAILADENFYEDAFSSMEKPDRWVGRETKGEKEGEIIDDLPAKVDKEDKNPSY